MIVVFADDFSGAAEIAGVGFSFGLKTQIQTNFEFDPNLDLLVVDMATRDKSISEAIKICAFLTREIFQSYPNALFYKKIDSVFRGHLVDEIEIHQSILKFDRVIVLPCNPRAGRHIINGLYFINDVLLSDTSFKFDPDFPRLSAKISELFKWKFEKPYRHLKLGEKLSNTTSIYTADVSETKDLLNLIKDTNQADLICGSGETFVEFLKKTGYKRTIKPVENRKSDLTVLINGSTIRNKEEQKELSDRKVPRFILPSKPEEVEAWNLKLLNSLEKNNSLAIYTNNDIVLESSNYLPNLLSLTAKKITHHFEYKNIHFLITGGATASTILSEIGCDKYAVVRENAQGVVTLQDYHNQRLTITIKPGSYPWGSIISELS